MQNKGDNNITNLIVNIIMAIVVVIIIYGLVKIGIKAFKNDPSKKGIERLMYFLASILLLISIIISAFDHLVTENFSTKGFINLTGIVGLLIAFSVISKRSKYHCIRKFIPNIFIAFSLALIILSFFYLFGENEIDLIENMSGTSLAIMSLAFIIIIDYLPEKKT